VNATILILAVLIFAAAVLYSSVGHAGSSGYLTIMALMGVTPAVMKPTALTLNILVAAIATVKFYRAGYFSWALFSPLAIASIPCSFIGGYLTLPASIYNPITGGALLVAAYKLFRTHHTTTATSQAIPLLAALLSGTAIGFLSGVTGIGGGIFLSPLLLLMGWADPRQSAGISAAFILVNSIAGLLGHLSHTTLLPKTIIFWAPSAIIGGFIGAEYGSKHKSANLQQLLSILLVIAGLKLLFSW